MLKLCKMYRAQKTIIVYNRKKYKQIKYNLNRAQKKTIIQ